MHPSKCFKQPRHMKISRWRILHDVKLENCSPIVDIRRGGFDVFELRSVNSPARTRSNLSKSLSMGSFSWASLSLKSFNWPRYGVITTSVSDPYPCCARYRTHF